MKKTFFLILILFTSGLTACGNKSSAIISVDDQKDVTVSNGDFDLTIYDIVQLDSKDLGTHKISLKEDARADYTLYEIRMRYTNLTDEPNKLSYKQLWVSLPDIEDSGDSLTVVGYCEPKAFNATEGNPTFCAYLPPPSSTGGYGVTGVFQASSLRVEPGEQAKLYFVVILEKKQSQLEISFLEPTEE